ncbi:hypothetical protein J6590_031732 [Homalodisca vitripennis]|nr:hypothetical protein J6590_031732 [Homalodisca vitripennis]
MWSKGRRRQHVVQRGSLTGEVQNCLQNPTFPVTRNIESRNSMFGRGVGRRDPAVSAIAGPKVEQQLPKAKHASDDTYSRHG